MRTSPCAPRSIEIPNLVILVLLIIAVVAAMVFSQSGVFNDL
jgi:Flp pilus assembly protein protease CpaA